MAIVLTTLVSEQPLADLSELTASIAKWAHRTDLGSMTGEFVRLAEARFRRELRLRCQITPAVLTVAANARGAPLPADWLEFKSVSSTTTPARVLSYVPFSQLDALPMGHLATYSIEGDALILGAVSAHAQSVSAVYYAALQSLLAGQTNWLMANHPSIYLFAALIECATYTRDAELLAAAGQRYAAEAAQLQAQDLRAASSGSALQVKPRGFR